MRLVPWLTLFLCLATAGQAVTLHCLGRDPNFMLVLDGETARLDYLGDGVFPLDPPLFEPLGEFIRTDLLASGGPVPIYLQRSACPAFGAMMPFSVELGVPAFAGQRPIFGCCREVPTQ